jgi:hypothetical protein
MLLVRVAGPMEVADEWSDLSSAVDRLPEPEVEVVVAQVNGDIHLAAPGFFPYVNARTRRDTSPPRRPFLRCTRPRFHVDVAGRFSKRDCWL